MITSVIAQAFTLENLLGEPSGFNGTVPPDYGYQPDVKLMAKLPEAEQKAIRLMIEVRNETNWFFLHFPNCLPSSKDLADGEKTSGMQSRDPRLTEHSETIDKILRTRNNYSDVDPLKRQLYELLGFPTSTEEYAKAGLGMGGPAVCHSVVGRGSHSSIYRGLRRYDANDIEKTILTNSLITRSRETYQQGVIFENLILGEFKYKTGFESKDKAQATMIPTFIKFSDGGKAILKAAQKYYNKELEILKRLNLATLKPIRDTHRVATNEKNVSETLAPINTQQENNVETRPQ